MKNIILNAVFATCGFIVSAQPTFVSTTPSNKNVIIEQFTYEDMGTPEADNLINRFMSENSSRVFGINIRDWTPMTIRDFTCEDGSAYIDYFKPDYNFDPVTFEILPGMVNRGNMGKMSSWENNVKTILSQPSCLNVAAQGSIDWDLRQLILTVEVYYTDNSNTNENYLTVALLQNNLEGEESSGFENPAQLLPNINYNHLRVLRDIISPTWGDTITETTEGSFFTKTYTYAIPDTIESTIVLDWLKERTIRPKVLLEDLEVLVFVAESKENIISGAKAEITHENVPKINLHTQLNNIYEFEIKCGDDFPLYLTLKNGGSDTIHSIEYNLFKDNQVIFQNQVWNSRPIYPFATDTVIIHAIPIDAGIKSLISIEIIQINEKDTLIAVENTFIRNLVEDARGAMKLIIAPPNPFANTIYFFLYNEKGEVVLSNLINWVNQWSSSMYPGITEYSYDFHPETTGCYSFYISDNLNKEEYGEGYFMLLSADGTILMYNDGKNCAGWSFFNVTEPYVAGTQDFYEKTISIQPNPAQTQFTVTNTENATIQLFNMLGQEILQVNSTEESTVINVDFLPQGIYFLKMLKDNNPSVHKIQVVR